MLTVACLLVHGHVGYTPEYVIRLRGMVKRHLTQPHRFVCLTDQEKKFTDIETIKIPSPNGIYAWWSKTRLFTPGYFVEGRVLYLDLDVLITRSIDPIVDYPSQFALVPHAGDFNGKEGKAVIKKYNSSVMVWNAGLHQQIYGEWKFSTARTLWGDQDWIADRVPDADTMPIEWFPRLSEIGGKVPPSARVILCKRPKNHIAAQQYPWFREAWR